MTDTPVVKATPVEQSGAIRLVIADVDGTLLTPDKILTPRARASVRALLDAGVAFTITSGRPPRGMKTLIDDLDLRSPLTAFNGGLVVRPDLSVVAEHVVTRLLAQKALDIVSECKMDAWVYTGGDWYVTSLDHPHTAREQWTVKFPPTVVSAYDRVLDRVVKIVGISDDGPTMARCIAKVRHMLGGLVSAALSEPYYLDITHPSANKGEVVNVLSALLAVPRAQIATIGDMPSDVPMFRRSGLSIAMGNASTEVQCAASFVTTPNTEDGFSLAMDRYVLGARTARLGADRLDDRCATNLVNHEESRP